MVNVFRVGSKSATNPEGKPVTNVLVAEPPMSKTIGVIDVSSHHVGLTVFKS